MVLSHSTGFPNWRFFYPENRLFIQFSPGTEFFYSGEGYMYLGKVIAHLKKCSLNQLDSDIQVKVNIPLEIKHAYFGKNEHISNHKAIGYIEGKTVEDIWDRTAFNPAASLHTGAQDYARLLIAIMTKNGLNHELINEMLNEHIQVPADDAFRTEDGYDSWALGIGIKKISDKIYYGHDGENGNFQSHFLFDRDKKNGYVFFTNCDRGYSFNKKLEKFMIE